jgi:hypothetical protein
MDSALRLIYASRVHEHSPGKVLTIASGHLVYYRTTETDNSEVYNTMVVSGHEWQYNAATRM